MIRRTFLKALGLAPIAPLGTLPAAARVWTWAIPSRRGQPSPGSARLSASGHVGTLDVTVRGKTTRVMVRV